MLGEMSTVLHKTFRHAKAFPSRGRWHEVPDEVETLRQMMPLERQRSDRKMNLMPRPPLLGEVAKPSGFDGEVLHQAAAAGAKPLRHGLRRDSSPTRGAVERQRD